MREFEYIFDEGLMRGLRSSERARARSQSLVKAYNVQATIDGLIGYKSIGIWDEWTKSGRSVDTKYPLVFNGYIYSFTAGMYPSIPGSSGLSYITASGQLYHLAHAWSYGSILSAADFGLYTVFACTYTMIVVDRGTGGMNTSQHAGNTDMPLVGTCCNFRGQFIGGNVKSDFHGCGKTSVVYSDIGSINMIPSSKNEAGNHFIPTSHTIISVFPLKDHIIVYTSGDLWALTPVTGPAPTFKLTPLGKISINDVRAVAGDDNKHLFIDSLGVMWQIDNSLKPVRLGYEEFFRDYIGELAVVFDPGTGEWRINTNDKSYVYTEFGLTTCFQKLTGFYYDSDTYLAVGADDDDLSAVVVTDKLDFGFRAIKTIHGMELSADSGSGVRVATDRRIKLRGNFNRTPFYPVSSMGLMGVPVAGIDFRIAVKFKHYEDTMLDYIKLRYKMSDLRGLRGVYSPPIRGQYAN